MDSFPPDIALIRTADQEKERKEALRKYRVDVMANIETEKAEMEFGQTSIIIKLTMPKSFRFELIKELQRIFAKVQIENQVDNGRGDYYIDWVDFNPAAVVNSSFERVKLTFRTK